jgi:hypothetical protein
MVVRDNISRTAGPSTALASRRSGRDDRVSRGGQPGRLSLYEFGGKKNFVQVGVPSICPRCAKRNLTGTQDYNSDKDTPTSRRFECDCDHGI